MFESLGLLFAPQWLGTEDRGGRNPRPGGPLGASILGCLFALSAPPPATAGSLPIYEFRLLELEVTGQNAFFDDFEDGDRFALPTSLLIDTTDSVQTESDGALILSDTDGATRRLIGGLVFVDDQIRYSPLFSDAGGSAEIIATLAPFGPDDNWQDINIRARSTLGGGITFGIDWNSDLAGFASPCGSSFQAYAWNAGAGTYLGCNPIAPQDIDGSVILAVAFDDTGNALSFRYSLDGGVSFVSMASFEVPVQPIGFPPLGQPFFFDLNANALPEPSAVLLLVISAGAVLGRVCPRRTARCWRSARFAALPLAIVLVPAAAPAAGFDFSLLELEITGQNAFFDDFEDGQRHSLPTSNLVDLSNAFGTSVTTESGGSLRFTSDDGFRGGNVGGFPFIADAVGYSPNFFNSLGSAEITATLAQVTPTDQFQDFILQLRPVNFRTIDAFFALGWNLEQIGVPSPCGSGFQTYVFNNESGAYLGCDGIDSASVSGTIVLHAVFDDASDEIVFRYSIDGGETFIAMSDFDVPTAPITGFPGLSNSFRLTLGAEGLPIPEPGLALLLLSAAAAVGLFRRSRGSGADVQLALSNSRTPSIRSVPRRVVRCSRRPESRS